MSSLSRKLIDTNKVPKSRIELHLHLEGAVRVSTLWELSQKKDIKITPNGTLKELQDYCLMKKPGKLSDCLNILGNISQVYHGDSNALERIAYEISEDEFKEGVLYFEVRMSPQLASNTIKINDKLPVLNSSHRNACSPKKVVESVLKGLKRGQQDFGIRSSLILSCLCGHPDWSSQVLQLIYEFQDRGVVGIDIAGNEGITEGSTHSFSQSDVLTFIKAKELGIHRTCHAGEIGPAANVSFAIDRMCAERIGHGYSVIKDKQIYQKCLSTNIHFETCPHSSYFTGAIKPSDRHSIVKFAEDGANFSLSKDDPITFGSTLDNEYEYMSELGLNEVHIIRANINAAKSSFLPEEDKNELLRQLYTIYGFN